MGSPRTSINKLQGLASNGTLDLTPWEKAVQEAVLLEAAPTSWSSGE